MNKERVINLSLFLLLLIVILVCFNHSQNMQEEIVLEQENTKNKLYELEEEINENTNNLQIVSGFSTEIQDIETAIDEIESEINSNRVYESLISLDSYELKKYEEFKEEYDDQVLYGLNPISICKMFLYAEWIKDYETEYEFYTTDEDYVLWTKEEDLIIPENQRTSDFSDYSKVYGLYVDYRMFDNIEMATVIWHVEDNEWGNIFSLMKENGIWKVGFLPIQ
jgi:hypothetical protein